MEKPDTSKIYQALCQLEQLQAGWSRVFANGGSPGGDRVSLHDFAVRREAELARLLTDLTYGVYHPGPLRRLAIPKRHGGSRPLAIPCVRDRVVQSALYLLLGPLLDATFDEGSFGYRPGKGVQEALRRVQALHREGYTHVLDADIERFFESVPHAPLLNQLREHVDDDRVIGLIALWLAQEPGGRGLAQGSPLSPLLSNLYLDTLDRKLEGKGTRIVRFADDFVVLCRSELLARETLRHATEVLSDLGLQLNAEKTHLVDFDHGFRFLGHHLVRSWILPDKDAEPPEPPGWAEHLPEEGEEEPAPAPPAEPVAAATVPAQSMAPFEAQLTPSPPAVRGEALPADDWLPDVVRPEDSHNLSPVTRVLYLVSPGRRLTVQGEAFAVMENAMVVALFPPRRLGRIEIGPDAHIDDNAIRHALAWRIPLAFTTRGGLTNGLVSSPVEQQATVHLQQASARLDPSRTLRLARAFVDARLRNQRALLNRLNRRRADPTTRSEAHAIGRATLKLKDAGDANTLRGLEGDATRRYWPAYGRMLAHGFSLTTRRRDPVGGPADLLLNFAAGMLTRDIEALVMRHGLHPGIGFLHEPRNEPGPLSWDLIEPFRAPLVEGFVAYAVNNRVVRLPHFSEDDGGAWVITPDGRDAFIRAYEAWLNRPVRNHRRGTESVWRGLIEDDILALRESLRTGDVFTPYLMDY